MPAQSDRVCSVDSCDRPHYGRGYCALHYKRVKRHQPELLGVAQCSVDACERPAWARLMCNLHYTRQMRHGSTDHPLGWGRQGQFERMVSGETDDCIIWPYSKSRKGYGNFRGEHRTLFVHVLACELANGPRPSGLQAAHSCGNPSCFNPRHLRWATQLENSADMMAHGTQARGERAHHHKLTESQVREIRALCAAGGQYRAVALIYGVNESTVSSIAKRETWKHISEAGRITADRAVA